MINLKHIESFVWVARLGRFGVAAQRLNATQPGISHRISALEGELGTTLFRREARRAVLTPKAREMLPYAEQMLRLRGEMLKLAESKNALRGVVRLGVSETIVYTRLVELMEKIRVTYPSIKLEIEVDSSRNLRTNLLDGGIDVAFLVGDVVEPHARNFAFVGFPLAWVASPRLQLPPGTLSLEQVARFPIITYLRDSWPHLTVRHLFLRHGVTNFNICGNASASTIIRLCVEGMGISVLPPAVIERELEERQLVLLRVAGGALPEMPFSISYLAIADTMLIEAIIELAMRP